MHSRRPLLLALALSLLALVAVAAGCGGGGGSPGIASLGTTGAATTTAGAGGGGGTSGGGAAPSGGGAQMALRLPSGTGTKFSACMRANGVPNFPDPNGQGVIQVGSSLGIDPRSPKFQAAQAKCRKLLPNGGQPTAQQQAKMQQAALAFSACMRKHGITDFPDPTFSNGGISIRLKAGSGGSDLNPNSPKFQAAQQACKNILPGAVGGPGGK